MRVTMIRELEPVCWDFEAGDTAAVRQFSPRFYMVLDRSIGPCGWI